MRIVAFADVHGRFDKVTDALRRVGPVDVAVVAGDLTTAGLPVDVEQAVAEWQPLVPRLLAVAGNMDSPAIEQALRRLGVSLDGCCQQVDSVAFFGCSASPISIGSPYEIPEAEMAARIERGFGQARDARQLVFVPHAPPMGAVDRTVSGQHAGSRSVGEFIRRVQPALVLCGHIHEARGQARLGRSLVVNCGPAAGGHYALVELNDGGCHARMF